jgi:deoxyribodipyrimidine photo-lyase
MNQMKTTGFMHNRARMLVVIFWSKYLLINPLHPKYGSQVGFSRLLVDAIGPSQNLMNHRWAIDFDFPGKKYSAPGAPLSGRPMNINNEMIKKWDPTCEYIKQWLPHLKDISNKELFKWNETLVSQYDNIHPGPMFNAKEKYQEWVNICKKVK